MRTAISCPLICEHIKPGRFGARSFGFETFGVDGRERLGRPKLVPRRRFLRDDRIGVAVRESNVSMAGSLGPSLVYPGSHTSLQ